MKRDEAMFKEFMISAAKWFDATPVWSKLLVIFLSILLPEIFAFFLIAFMIAWFEGSE